MKEEIKKKLHKELIEDVLDMQGSLKSMWRIFYLGVSAAFIIFGLMGVVNITAKSWVGINYLFFSGIFFVFMVALLYDKSRIFYEYEKRMEEREQLYSEVVGEVSK